MEDQRIDVNNPVLLPKHWDSWFKATEALPPRMPCELTTDEAAGGVGEDLAALQETNCRKGYPPHPDGGRKRMVRFHSGSKDPNNFRPRHLSARAKRARKRWTERT